MVVSASVSLSAPLCSVVAYSLVKSRRTFKISEFVAIFAVVFCQLRLRRVPIFFTYSTIFNKMKPFNKCTRLLKKVHLRCCTHHASLRRTKKYASFLMVSRA